MFKRDIETELKLAAASYPVITIMGPRQSGKTTVVKKCFPKKAYVNLEALDTRTFAEIDPRGFLNQFPEGAILDEIQHVPSLLSYIQEEVDTIKQKGRYILTGSYQMALHNAISQSLAGRTTILTLLPMTIGELKKAKIDLTLDEYLLNGFFPAIYADKLQPSKAYRNYVQTYVERDVRQLSHIKDLKLFQNFLKLCAGRVGSVLNKESLGNDLGISAKTVHEWLSILEASFVIFQLQPYFENFGKRVIKSPKLYFTDVGMLVYLLDIENISQLARDPLRGFMVENLVILELMKSRLNHGMEPKLYYFRDNHQHEVDVIVKHSNQLIPVEIKATQTFHPGLLKGIQYYHSLSPEKISQGYLVYAGEKQQTVNNIKVLNFKNAHKIL
ncbi:MAG: ATP-binding protein [Gammaproteobacteria bacterium]|nr:ATP-binding protein [Gammaproteobacteria bacterium]